MTAELNVLDWLMAGGQGLAAASFLYFCFLVMRHWKLLRFSRPEATWRPVPERTRDAFVARWQGESANGDTGQDAHVPRSRGTGAHDTRAVNGAR